MIIFYFIKYSKEYIVRPTKAIHRYSAVYPTTDPIVFNKNETIEPITPGTADADF